MTRIDPLAMDARLLALPRHARLAFGLGCSERLYPNYLAFQRECGWGEPSVLRHALDFAWSVLEGAGPSTTRIKSLMQGVREAEPETEDFDTILVSSALDAAAGAGLIREFIDGDDVNKISELASLCRDTVDMFVQHLESLEPHDPELEDKILRHRLMQRELKRQEDDLRVVESFSGSKSEVAKLRELWRAPGTSNIEQVG